MAAHPFGPIETFLLRGYKKMGFDPQRVRPVFEEQRVKIFDINTPPYWFFHNFDIDTYELERTAIVNSSNCDVQSVVQNYKMDLLSRGLGYRITFTMPADREFQIHDQSTWPGVHFQVLDMFGENILRTVSIPQGQPISHFEGLAKDIAKMNSESSVEVEFTVERVRIVVDNVREIDVPLYFADKKSMQFQTQVHKGFSIIKVLQIIDGNEKSQLRQRFDLLREFLRNNHSKMSQIHKDKLKQTLLAIICCLYTQKGPVIRLKKDLESWFQNKGAFPEYFDAKFTSEILKKCSKENVSMNFLTSQLSLSAFLVHNFCVQAPNVFYTNNFVIVEAFPSFSKSQVSYCDKVSAHLPDCWQTIDLGHANPQVSVVASQDILVSSKYFEDYDLSFWKLQQTATDKKHSHQLLFHKHVTADNLFFGTDGIFIWNHPSNAREEPNIEEFLLMSFYSYSELERFHRQFPDEVLPPKIKRSFGTEIQFVDSLSLKQTTHSDCHYINMAFCQSQRSKLTFMCLGVTETSFCRWIFSCLKEGIQVLKSAEFCTPKEQWTNAVSVLAEDSRGRMYGCILDCSTSKEAVFDRLFIVVYYRGQFVPIGRRNKPTPGVFMIPHHKRTDYLTGKGQLSERDFLFTKGSPYFDRHSCTCETRHTLKLKH